MPRIVKIRNLNMHCFTPEVERIPNVILGRNSRIHTNMLLTGDPKYNKLINENTMGALDNYAQHENMDIYITPLENDMFNDLRVSIFKKGYEDKKFPMDVAKTREETPEFFKELYTKVHKSIHPNEGTRPVQGIKKSLWNDFKTYAENVADRIHEYKMAKIRKFIMENEYKSGLKRAIADTLEELHYDELYKNI